MPSQGVGFSTFLDGPGLFGSTTFELCWTSTILVDVQIPTIEKDPNGDEV